MIVTNRYDNLMAKAKKLRNKIENKTIKTDVKVKELQTKIAKLKYQKNVYCKDLNNKLTDVTSLIRNERERIKKDSEEEGGENE